MKKTFFAVTLLSMSIGVAMAGGFGGSTEVTVTAGTSEFSNAFGTNTSATNNGFANGSAVVWNRGGFATAEFSTTHAGSASGYNFSKTDGAGSGGLNIEIGRNSLTADAGAGQEQSSQTGGSGWYHFGGNTQASGAANAAVEGAKAGAEFNAGDSGAQSANSGWGWSNVSSINGGVDAGGAINFSAAYHH